MDCRPKVRAEFRERDFEYKQFLEWLILTCLVSQSCRLSFLSDPTRPLNVTIAKMKERRQRQVGSLARHVRTMPRFGHFPLSVSALRLADHSHYLTDTPAVPGMTFCNRK
ncbi:hypothetical protein L596_021112 [Steinernema carpocapsae]|uniref:Uncharacterized protein n=1 Tax=Steinernema carpocapsae TaxID=34508 RepID=A0A4U5MVH3_STECR|nr:hypothetical protein L596_021112 [Steinernema carpocapsae]